MKTIWLQLFLLISSSSSVQIIFNIALYRFSLIFISGLLFFNTGKSQIVLEHQLDSTGVPYFYYTDIGNNDFKYVRLNLQQNSFSLFNMDMTPYLINITVPNTGDSLSEDFTVIYITKALFDCDTNTIEYVFENPYDIHSTFRVYRIDGTLLLEVDSANGPYYIGGGLFGGSNSFVPIANTSDGAKLYLQKYDQNQTPQLLIYDLCGTLPDQVFTLQKQYSFVKVFPNPSSGKLNFEIILPSNSEQYILSITDADGRQISRIELNKFQKYYAFDTLDQADGTYIFTLSTINKIYQTGKFVINK